MEFPLVFPLFFCYPISRKWGKIMFFVMGIEDGQCELGFDQTMICPICGRFGHLRVSMTYTCMSLFFLPIWKWGKRYYAVMSCCGARCQLDDQLGRKIARGHISSLDPSELEFSSQDGGSRRCRCCGYETTEAFAFCPKCGTRF